MAERKPNTICKNVNCTKGADGGRKHYYSCRYCVSSGNWRSVACSWECYEAYCNQVMAARSQGQIVDTLPERTDLSKDEVKELILTEDMDAVAAESRVELADVFASHQAIGFAEAVDVVNEELDKKAKRKWNVIKRSGAQ